VTRRRRPGPYQFRKNEMSEGSGILFTSRGVAFGIEGSPRVDSWGGEGRISLIGISEEQWGELTWRDQGRVWSRLTSW